MVSPCSFSSFSFICFVVLLSSGGIGGADRTFACKSQECIWQDWYSCGLLLSVLEIPTIWMIDESEELKSKLHKHKKTTYFTREFSNN